MTNKSNSNNHQEPQRGNPQDLAFSNIRDESGWPLEAMRNKKREITILIDF
jgi:hypothetical protein